MARWKARVEFLLSVIELRFLSLTAEALQGKMCQKSLPSGGVSHLESRFQGEGVVPRQYIDTTRKAIDCATTLLLTVFGRGRPFVKPFTLMLSVRFPVCPVCLSVMFMHCGQKVGRIKMTFGMQVGLGPGHIVLDGDPAAPPQRGTALQSSNWTSDLFSTYSYIFNVN